MRFFSTWPLIIKTRRPRPTNDHARSRHTERAPSDPSQAGLSVLIESRLWTRVPRELTRPVAADLPAHTSELARYCDSQCALPQVVPGTLPSSRQIPKSHYAPRFPGTLPFPPIPDFDGNDRAVPGGGPPPAGGPHC
jgi:hypothetical protein